MELNEQQIDFLIDELTGIMESSNYSETSKKIAEQLYQKILQLK